VSKKPCDGSQRIHVASAIRLDSCCLFRAHESGRSLNLGLNASHPDFGFECRLSQTEVQQFGNVKQLATLRQENITGFDIAVY
jgi:hypothetical protein